MTTVRHNVPGSSLTTLRLGGPCDTVIDVATSSELLDVVGVHPEAVTIGGGSNLIVRDEGVRTPLIRMYSRSSSPEIHVDAESARVDVSAAVDWDTLVQHTVDAGLHGLECTSGVPGSVGGAVVQNLGAYGQEVAQVIAQVTAYDTSTKTVVQLTPEQCVFSYRNSRFKHDETRRFVIARVQLQLTPAMRAAPRYGDVRSLLQRRWGAGEEFALSDIRRAVLDVRETKGMLLGASKPSAGSFFTNPELDLTTFERVKNNDGVRELMRTDTMVRVSAAALMEGAGYKKGDVFGNIGLSERHVLAFVNLGDATARELLDVAAEVAVTVESRTGIHLTPEPVVL